MNARSSCKEELSKSYGDLDVLVAEDDFDEIITQREWMKTLYVKFRDSHVEYHETLQEESVINTSYAYFRDIQTLYAGMRLGFGKNSGKFNVAIDSSPIQHSRF